MGAIRTLLALSVLLNHVTGVVFVGGVLAVKLFYMISGFLISYILVERRSYASVSSFYLNRALRLFPIYWLVAAVTLLMYGVALVVPSAADIFRVHDDFGEVYHRVGVTGVLLLVVSNVILFGQDWVMFTGVRHGVFQFVTNFRISDIAVWRGLLVPQAWTLGIELSFYLVAPYLLQRRAAIAAALLASVALRLVLIEMGFGAEDPWTYRFFPTELALFLMGALSHQVLLPIYRRRLADRLGLASKCATGIIFSYCVVYFLLPGRDINTLILMTLFALSLPFLFVFQSASEFDQRIGDLSYPIYISHMMVLAPVTALMKRWFDLESYAVATAVCIVTVTVLVSIGLNHFVGERIEAFRGRVRSA